MYLGVADLQNADVPHMYIPDFNIILLSLVLTYQRQLTWLLIATSRESRWSYYIYHIGKYRHCTGVPQD